MNEDTPIGPDSCPTCGGEYGEHTENCTCFDFFVDSPLNISDNELSAKIATDILNKSLAGECIAWDPEGSGYSIFRPDELHSGELRLVEVAYCNCDIKLERRKIDLDSLAEWREFASFKDSSDEEIKAIIDEMNKEDQDKWDAEVALWGHPSYCLNVLPDYTNNESAIFKEVIPAMQKLGFCFLVELLSQENDLYYANFTKYTVQCSFGGSSQNKNPSRAICEAAINAITALNNVNKRNII